MQVPLRSYIGISQQPQNNKRQNTTETHKPIHKQNTDHKTLLVTEAPFTTHLHERCLAVFRDFITCCTFLSFKSKTCGCHEMTAKNRFYIQNKFFKSAKNTKLFTKSTTCHDKLPNLSRTEISDANHHDFFFSSCRARSRLGRSSKRLVVDQLFSRCKRTQKARCLSKVETKQPKHKHKQANTQ